MSLFRTQIMAKAAGNLKARQPTPLRFTLFSTTSVAQRASLAKAQIVGHVARDAEFREWPGQEGVPQDEKKGIWKWSVAVNRPVGRNEGTGEWIQETDWWSVVSKNSHQGERVRKGATVFCDGNLKSRKVPNEASEKSTTFVELDCTQGTVQEVAPPKEYMMEPGTYGANSHIVADPGALGEHQEYQEQAGQYQQRQQASRRRGW
ncbi:hypothetical protein HDV00_003069 [Rhizophlyctis rosea]|nr:hypothetical protein HDV00_003069 [Rhizophlyctis rosea]